MKNITVKVDDETYRNARVIAAKQETSVSALFREFLVNLNAQSNEEAASEEARLKQRRENLQKLWDMADARDSKKSGKAGPFSREEIYEERIR